MKIVNTSDRKIGIYYMVYHKCNGVCKGISIFKYESIFGDMVMRLMTNYNWGVELFEDMNAPVMEHDEVITFELDTDEVFKHITMELVTQNL